MSFEFIIPSKHADLLDINAPKNGYYVKKVHQVGEIPELLRKARTASQVNIYYIFDHFDVFFSVIERASSVSPSLALNAFDLLFASTDKLGKTLVSSLEQSSLEAQERDTLRNATKMILYLMTALTRVTDQIYLNNCPSGDKKKATQKNNDNFDLMNWADKRAGSLIQLFNLLQLPLEKLWERSIAEEAFVTKICDVAYRTLELAFIRVESVSDAVFQILGVAIKRYNHALHFPVRILSILRSCETAVHSIADGVCLLEEDFGITSLCPMLLKDLLQTLSDESEDSQTVKHATLFLHRLASVAPNLIMPHIGMLADSILNLQAYQMRNCILQIMGDIVRNKLTSDDLSDEMKEVRDEYLEHLYDHGQDVNSYVRSKVLQIWIQLKDDMAIPLVWLNKVLRLAMQRLEDKSAFVRKYAVTLIISFLTSNPFASNLSLEERKQEEMVQEQKLQNLRDKMLQIEREWTDILQDVGAIVTEYLTHLDTNGNSQISHESCASKQMDNNQVVEIIMSYIEKKDYLSALKAVYNSDNTIASNSMENMVLERKCSYYLALLQSYYYMWRDHGVILLEFEQQKSIVQFYEDCIDFMAILEEAIPKIVELLSSKTNADVCEAINLFTTAYQFSVKGTLEGMHKMLSVIWSNDKEKKEAVSAAYKKILFTTDCKGRPHAAKVVKNLCNFMGETSIGRYISMEFLINQWVQDEDIDHQIIQILFERFTMKLEDTTEKEAREALQLLVLISRTKPSMANANMSVIENIAFSERGLSDPLLYANCLDFLMNINVGKNIVKRITRDSDIVKKVCDSFLFFFTQEIENFNEIASKTTQFIYTMIQSPDAVCEDMFLTMFERSKQFTNQDHQDRWSQESVRQSQTSRSITLILPSEIICRLIYTLGMFAMRELIFLDTYVYNNMKYRQELKNMKNRVVNGHANKSFSSPSLNTSASNALKKITEAEEEALVGPTAEDNTAEVINFICEEVLLFKPQSLLRKFTSSIIHVCREPAIYCNDELQQTTIMTIVRLMCVSSKFCEINLGLLMNILTGTKNSAIKCNIIVGVADLTFRSTNVTEPWSGQFFSTLHDRDLKVRLTTVKMLSYLILNEMLRVKGQISDLALRLVDENDEIRTSCEEFFKEVSSTKSTIVYNVMPDIISRLGDPSLNLEEEKYRTIMRFIMKLIRKDKHIENLVDKLCLRFRMITMDRQWRDLAFCLSLLPYNEKSIKKLIENVNYFKKKILNDDIYDAFKIIITNTGKLAKQPLKDLVKELEYKLEQCRNVDPDEEENHDEATGHNRSQQQEKVNSKNVRRRRQPAKQKKRSGRFAPDSDDDDDAFESDNDRENKVPTQNSRPRRVTKNLTRVVESDNSSSDSDERQSVTRSKKLRK